LFYRQISIIAYLDAKQEVAHRVAPQHDSARVDRVPSGQAPEMHMGDLKVGSFTNKCNERLRIAYYADDPRCVTQSRKKQHRA
jgi:hypothetical protein